MIQMSVYWLQRINVVKQSCSCGSLSVPQSLCRSVSCYRQNSQLFQNLLTDMDVLLGSNKDFLLGHWLEAAKAVGTTVLVSQSQSVRFSFGI